MGHFPRISPSGRILPNGELSPVFKSTRNTIALRTFEPRCRRFVDKCTPCVCGEWRVGRFVSTSTSGTRTCCLATPRRKSGESRVDRSRNSAHRRKTPEKSTIIPSPHHQTAACRMWQFLYFLPLPHGQGSLRPTRSPRLRIGSGFLSPCWLLAMAACCCPRMLSPLLAT